METINQTELTEILKLHDDCISEEQTDKICSTIRKYGFSVLEKTGTIKRTIKAKK